ncbi:DUF2490 domain-containing protein [Ascidiimonas sp. W6]|uniref:DUF2490 domain-containing protein n=1 Tax=Ascidiimonas meishanensis TaxID=3128903 RepID=UPI0030EBDBB4
MILIFILFSQLGYAQSDLIGYWEPEVSFNYAVTSNYRHNFGIRKRSFIYTDDQTELRLRQIDISHFSNWKVNANESLGGGILYRFRDGFEGGSNELRITQQYNYAIRPVAIRFGHRIRAEQRITTLKTIHRFRYRFAVDFALNGEKTDIGEAYLAISTEALLSVAKASLPAYDHRLTIQIGWLLTDKLRFQTGTEYRSENFVKGTEPVLLFLSSLIFSI